HVSVACGLSIKDGRTWSLLVSSELAARRTRQRSNAIPGRVGTFAVQRSFLGSSDHPHRAPAKAPRCTARPKPTNASRRTSTTPSGPYVLSLEPIEVEPNTVMARPTAE